MVSSIPSDSNDINLENLLKSIEQIATDQTQNSFLAVSKNQDEVVGFKVLSRNEEGFTQAKVEDIVFISNKILESYSVEAFKSHRPPLPKEYKWSKETWNWSKALNRILDFINYRFVKELRNDEATDKGLIRQTIESVKSYVFSFFHSKDPRAELAKEELAKLTANFTQEFQKADKLFFTAIRQGNARDLAFLMTLGIETTRKDIVGLSPLQLAVLNGKGPDVLFVLQAHGADLKEVDSKGNNLFHFAALGGNAETFSSLMMNIRYPNPLSKEPQQDRLMIENAEGKTPLMLAAEKGHNAILQMILDEYSKYKENYPIDEVDKALVIAVNNKNMVAIEALLPKASPERKMEALTIATEKGSLPMVEKLTYGKDGARLDNQIAGKLAIAATKKGNKKVLHKFLAVVSGPDKRKFINSLLSVAAENNQKEISKFLMEEPHHAKMRSEALIAAAKEGHLDYIEHFKKDLKEEFPAYPVARNAMLKGHLDVVQWVLKNYPTVSVPDLLEETVKEQKIEFLEELLKIQQTQTTLKNTYQYIGSRNAKSFEMKQIIWNKLSSETRGKGSSPLRLALESGQKEYVDAVLQHNPILTETWKIGPLDAETFSIIDLAIEKGSVKVIQKWLEGNPHPDKVGKAYEDTVKSNSVTPAQFEVMQVLWAHVPNKEEFVENFEGPPIRLAIVTAKPKNVEAVVNRGATKDDTWQSGNKIVSAKDYAEEVESKHPGLKLFSH